MTHAQNYGTHGECDVNIISISSLMSPLLNLKNNEILKVLLILETGVTSASEQVSAT